MQCTYFISQGSSIVAYIAFFPEAHGQILAAHQYTPQKELLLWLLELDCK